MSDERTCVTCGDVAAPMRVLALADARELALCVDADGRRQQVDVGLLEAVTVGETLLVHAGTALAREARA